MWCLWDYELPYTEGKNIYHWKIISLYPRLRVYSLHSDRRKLHVCTVHTLSGDVMFRDMGAKFVRYASLYFSVVIKMPNVSRSFLISMWFLSFSLTPPFFLSLSFSHTQHAYTRTYILLYILLLSLSLTHSYIYICTHTRTRTHTLIRRHYTTTPQNSEAH